MQGKQARRCVGCYRTFEPKRPNQAYHARWCQKANAQKRGGQRAAYPQPRLALVNSFHAFFEESMPPGAIGFRLVCRELDLTLPQPGSPRRDGSRPRSEDFQLDPLEIPLLPLITTYAVIWVHEGGVALPAHPVQYVSPGWVDRMLTMGEVGRRLKLYLKRRRAESLANKRLIEQQANNMLQLLVAADEKAALSHQLPPHEQGNPGDDSDTT